MIYIVDYSNY